MTPQISRIRRAKAVFQCAVELDVHGRPGFVSDACGDDLELRGIVESLLGADASSPQSFGTRDAIRASSRREASHPAPAGYEHVRPLGHGGSGRVDLCRHRASGALTPSAISYRRAPRYWLIGCAKCKPYSRAKLS